MPVAVAIATVGVVVVAVVSTAKAVESLFESKDD